MIFYRILSSLTTRHILFLCNGDFFIKHVRIKIILNILDKSIRCINKNYTHEANTHWSLPPLCGSLWWEWSEDRGTVTGDTVWLNAARFATRKGAPKGAPTALPTGRFLAESKYKISNEEERPSLAWSLSALMSVSTYEKRMKSLSRCISTRLDYFYLIRSVMLKKRRRVGK